VLLKTDSKRTRLIDIHAKKQVRFLTPNELPGEKWVEMDGGRELFKPSFNNCSFSEDGTHLILYGRQRMAIPIINGQLDLATIKNTSLSEMDCYDGGQTINSRMHSFEFKKSWHDYGNGAFRFEMKYDKPTVLKLAETTYDEIPFPREFGRSIQNPVLPFSLAPNHDLALVGVDPECFLLESQK
jgi:hypothetical protein